MKKLQKDRLLGIIVLLIAAFFAINTSKLGATNFEGDPGPKMFPYMGCIIIAICGAILIVCPGKKQEGAPFLTREQFKSAALLFGIYVLFVLMLVYIGVLVTVPVILFIISFLFSKVSRPDASLGSRLVKSLIYTVIVSVGLYLLYIVALDSKFPVGKLWKLLK